MVGRAAMGWMGGDGVWAARVMMGEGCDAVEGAENTADKGGGGEGGEGGGERGWRGWLGARAAGGAERVMAVMGCKWRGCWW